MRLDGAAPRPHAGGVSPHFVDFVFTIYFSLQKGKKNRPQLKQRARKPVTVPGFGGEIRVSLGKRNTEIRRAEKNQTKTTKKPGRGLSLSGLVKAARIPVLFWPTVTYFLFVFK